MIYRERLELPVHVYPPDGWRLVEKEFYPPFLAATETLFATANGYLGMRGTFEEGAPVVQSGTFVNGFYESWPIVYGEVAYGFATTGQTIVNITDSKIIKLYIDDEPFFLPTAHLLQYERALNMKAGTLDREILWETPAGKQVSITSRRLVSFQHRHLAAIAYEVTVLNADAPVVISSEIIHDHASYIHEASHGDPRQGQRLRGKALDPKIHYVRDHRIVLSHVTHNSKMRLACGIDHAFETACSYSVETKCGGDAGKVVFSIDAKPGKPMRLIKYMTYHTSRSAPPEELCERAERTLERGARHGFADLLAGQQEYMDDVPAKGLTGQGYEGHYFWDAEIYVLPFLIFTAPRIARNLLKFRHSYLDKARMRAREVNQRGALFPWRTINGDEASAYYAAGTAQYHINADIMYALRKYVHITGDEEFLHDVGAEMLVETARLWADLGFYSERKGGKFCIHGVTGPDEYNTVVDNNTFTNLMARENLWYAVETVESLRKQKPDVLAALVYKTGLDLSEVKDWKRAADSMYIPFDEKMGIHPQDDSFLDKEPWDFKNTPIEKYPLLLHHHPLVIYRHAVIKQADVVLAMFLLEHEFSMEQKRRNFDYYNPMTTGDSSLSVSIQAIVAGELGYREKAGEYAWYGALMDLADVGGNVRDGCHIASMGGTWMAVVYGLAGMRDWDGKVSFRPKPPLKFDGLRFPLTIHGQLLEVHVTRESVTYTLREGDSLVIRHEDEEIRLSPENPIVVRPYATRS
jgi:alpha,alpha-trehalose phosphorylase